MKSLALLLALASCQSALPDEVHAGVQYRDENFSPPGGASEYGGEVWFLKGVYYLKPRKTLVDWTPELRLWKTELEHMHQEPPAPGDVNVNLPKPKGAVGEAGDVARDLINSAKGGDGDFAWEGVAALLAVVLLVVAVVFLRKK